MRYLYLLIILLLGACEQKNDLSSEDTNDTTTFITNDSIPEIRITVSKKPVASYLLPVGNPKLKYKFGVEVYETPKTFNYLLRMQYEWLKVSDTLKIPNFGTWPVVQVKPGKNKLSCIIGFLHKKKEFKEYKMLTVKNEQLKLVVLKRYFVGVYSDKASSTQEK